MVATCDRLATKQRHAKWQKIATHRDSDFCPIAEFLAVDNANEEGELYELSPKGLSASPRENTYLIVQLIPKLHCKPCYTY